MKNVLIDNWSLEEIALDLNNEKKLLKNKAFHNILEAIVLWDNVYFPQNDHAGFWNYMTYESDLKNYLTECPDNNEFYTTSKLLYEKYCKDQYTENLACGAIRYGFLAEKLGYDYLPCERRGQFIQESNIHSIICEEKGNYVNGQVNNSLTKIDYFMPINNEVKSFFKEYNEYYGKNVFEFKLPVLANYIINSKTKDKTFFEYAKELKKKLPVKQFLMYLNYIDKEISNGNFIPCNRFRNDVQELVKDICIMDKSMIFSIDVTMIPKLVLNFDLFKIRKVNYSFIKKIIKFSL